MKKWISYIVSVIVVGLYLLSTMGYGIHECSVSGTKNMIVLFGESPCEYVHHGKKSQECSCGSCCAGSHAGHSASKGECHTEAIHKLEHCAEDNGLHGEEHDSNCCTTKTFVLSHDQINSQQYTYNEYSGDDTPDGGIMYACMPVAVCASSVSTVAPSLIKIPIYPSLAGDTPSAALQIVAASILLI